MTNDWAIGPAETIPMDAAAAMFGLTRDGMEGALKQICEGWCFWAIRAGYLTGDQVLRLLKAGWTVPSSTWEGDDARQKHTGA